MSPLLRPTCHLKDMTLDMFSKENCIFFFIIDSTLGKQNPLIFMGKKMLSVVSWVNTEIVEAFSCGICGDFAMLFSDEKFSAASHRLVLV